MASPPQRTRSIPNRRFCIPFAPPLTGQLRPSDPPLFETLYEWNQDSLLTRVVYPNGNISSNTYELALNPAAPRRSRGNLRTRSRLPGPLGGGQTRLVERFEYDTTFGGCCGFNFVSKQTDARSNVTYHAYDARGNRTNTIHRVATSTESWEYNGFGQLTAHTLPDSGTNQHRRDVYTYYASGTQRGYRYQDVVDATGLALTTTYEYDAVGNPVRILDRRGNDWLYTYNQLDQRVSERSAEVTPGSGVRFQKDQYYDANNNLIRRDIQNLGGGGVPHPRPPCGGCQTNLSTFFDFDILNRPVRMTRVVDVAQSVVTENNYDANGNLILVRSGEATNGRQPANIVQSQYDERDKPFRTVRAPSSVDQSSEQYDYDANGNTTRVSLGLESGARTNKLTYDGYNRLTSATDPMGNVRLFQYDPNANVIVAKVEGELTDLPGSASNVRLSETTYIYDAMDRLTRTTVAFFDPVTQLLLDDGQANRDFFSQPSHRNWNKKLERVV